ncbi:unnamed protein product [Heterobilharzia americana]|nr:unnamed protein product [Heterobilharzia americana]
MELFKPPINNDTLMTTVSTNLLNTKHIINNNDFYSFTSTHKNFVNEYLVNTSIKVIRTLRSTIESNEQSINWTVLCLTGTLIILTWLANCILLGGALQTAGSGKNVPVAYFFIGSQAIAALLHVTLNLPPSIVNMLFGTSQVHSYTFFLDAYLRLRNPLFYLSSARRRPALWLKIGSPWLMASLQAIGQLALSDRHQVRLYTTISKNRISNDQQYSMIQLNSRQKLTDFNLNTSCLLQDPNFLIIRTVIAYALPLFTCLILVILQLNGLRRLRYHSPEMLNALLNVRKTNINEYDQLIYVQDNLIPSQEFVNFNRQNMLNTHNSEVIWRQRNNNLLNNTNSSLTTIGTTHLLTNNPNRRLSIMTNSYHFDPTQTNETLIPQSDTSIDRIHLTRSLLSPIILPIASVNNLQSFTTTTTTSIPMFKCPTHEKSDQILGNTTLGLQNESTLKATDCSDNHDAHMTESTSTNNINNNDLTMKSNITWNEPTTSDTILLNIDGAQVKLLPISYQQESVSSIGLSPQQYMPSVISTTLLPQHYHYTKPTTDEIGVISTDKLHKSKSDYHIKPQDEVITSNLYDHIIRSNSMKVNYTQPASTGTLSHENSVHNLSKTNLWLTAYQGEQLVVAINLVSCIIAVGIWSPYILATLAHGLCQPISISKSMINQVMHPLTTSTVSSNQFYPSSSSSSILTAIGTGLSNQFISKCWIHLSIDRLADFRWWAYASSGLLLPCLLFFLDLGLREGCWKALQYKTKLNLETNLSKTFQQKNIHKYTNTTKKNTKSNEDNRHIQSITNSIINTDLNVKSTQSQEYEMITPISYMHKQDHNS